MRSRSFAGCLSLAGLALVFSCGPHTSGLRATDDPSLPPLVDDLPPATCTAHLPTNAPLAPSPRARSAGKPAKRARPPLEVAIGSMGDGHELGKIPEKTRSALHLVLDAPYQSWAGEGTFVHLLALDNQFRPAKNADVYVDGRHIGRMNEHGTLAFRRQPKGKDKSAGGQLVVKHGKTYGWLDYSANSRTKSFDEPAIYVYTDRGIYNPGQTIRIRAVAWTLRGEFRPLSNKDVDVELLRAGRIVGGGVMRTDPWGIATMEIPLPPNAREGRFKLVARHGKESASGDLRVERFVPPSIEIRHNLSRFLTPAQSTLPMVLNLGYFNGSAFKAGNVELAVIVHGRDVHHEKHDVKGPGPHTYVLSETAMRKVHAAAGGASHVRVELTVRDELGRSDAVRRDMRYQTNPYKAVIELDRTRYAAGDPVNAMVRIVDLDGVPVRKRQVKLEVPSRGVLKKQTDEGGIARFTFVTPGLDPDLDESLLARVSDVSEPIATATLPIEKPLPMRSSVANTVVEEGIDVPLEVAFPMNVTPLEKVVHGDIVDSSGALIQSFTVPIVRERGRPLARGTFKAPSWGSMLLTLFCVGNKNGDRGLLTDGQNLAVHPRNRTLKVTLQGLPETTAPGTSLKLGIEVKGPDDKPYEAMLGASVVDAAVLSLLDPLERAPKDRFYNPDRKVLASTGAQTLTWPVVQRNWGKDTYDIGWPPQFGFHTGVGPKKRRWGGAASGYGSLWGNEIGESFGAGGLGLSGVGEGGGGSGEGIGLGSIGTIGHGAGSSRPRVVVRTNFQETSIWIPRLLARDGKSSLAFKVPDGITNQKISLVATDAEGRIGVAKVDLPVRQDLYARAHLPPSMIEGDKLQVPITVRNATKQPQNVTVSLSSSSLRISTPKKSLQVPPDGTVAAYFETQALRPGKARYEVVADATGSSVNLRDVSRREIVVLPRGRSAEKTHQGVVARGSPFRAVVERDKTDRKHVVRLRVAFPESVPALQGLMSLVERGYFGADPAASRVLGATAALRYLEKHKRISGAQREELRLWLGEVATAMLMGQNPDGGWGWYWDRKSQPYISAYALHGLLEMEDLGFPIPREAIRKAVGYVAGALRPDGLYSASTIAVWEGGDTKARMMVTAEIFDVLSRVKKQQRGAGYTAAMDTLEDRFHAYLSTATPDLLVYAHAVSGLARRTKGGKSAELRKAAKRLARMRNETHWEPGWFHACGGAIEASATVLDVLRRLDSNAFESERRDAVKFLLSTQGSWGGWHNARSTAFAIRALTELEPAPKSDCGVVVVRVDGREVRRVPVNAADPFRTAATLRSVELPAMGAGKHAVDVLYNGGSRADVRVSVERWSGAGTPASGSVGVQARAPARLDLGGRGEIVLGVSAPKKLGALVVEQKLGSTLSVDTKVLDKLRKDGAIRHYESRSDGVRVALPPGGGEIRLKVEAIMPGTATIPGAEVRAVADRSQTGRAPDRQVVVSP